MANNILAGQGNCLVTKTAKTLAGYGFDDTNTTIVYQPGSPNKSWRPTGTLNTLTGTIPAGTGLYVVAKGTSRDATADFHPDGTEAGSSGGSGTAVTWTQLHVATDTSGGTLSKAPDAVTGTAENAGGTVTGKLTKANGNFVEYVVTNPVAATTGAILGLSPNNNGSYVFGTDTFLAGMFVFADTSVAKWFSGTGSNEAIAQSGVVAGAVLRLEIANTDDVLMKYNGTTVHTFTGVLSGVTNIWIKGMFAGTNASGDTTVRKLLTVKGTGIA